MEMNQKSNKESISRFYRILIIDDEKDSVDLLELILSRQNYIVDKAYTAKEAYRILKNGNIPDLILLDIKMPGKDGLTFCLELKQNFQYRHIPIIILSALILPSDIDKGSYCEAADYIQKPWSNEDLIYRINRQISSNYH